MKALNKYTLIFTISILLLGFIYQSYSSYLDSKEYPIRGNLFDLGGYKLHLEKYGEGNVTVVFDAGMGDDFSAWKKVYSEVSQFAKVIGYDRAGLGWSDKSPLPRNSQNIIAELHLLIHKANIDGPLILVGHSFGGVNMQLYAMTHPESIAGIILVDSAHEQEIDKLPKRSILRKYLFKAGMRAAPIGIPRLYLSSKNPIERAKKSTTKHQYTSLAEAHFFPDSLKMLSELNPNFGDLPLTVIARRAASHEIAPDIKRDFEWAKLQEELFSRSSNSKIIYTGQKQHSIHKNQPEIVISAIQDMVNLVDK